MLALHLARACAVLTARSRGAARPAIGLGQGGVHLAPAAAGGQAVEVLLGGQLAPSLSQVRGARGEATQAGRLLTPVAPAALTFPLSPVPPPLPTSSPLPDALPPVLHLLPQSFSDPFQPVSAVAMQLLRRPLWSSVLHGLHGETHSVRHGKHLGEPGPETP